MLNFSLCLKIINKARLKIKKIKDNKNNSSFSIVSVEILKIVEVQEVMLFGYTFYLASMIIYTQRNFNSFEELLKYNG